MTLKSSIEKIIKKNGARVGVAMHHIETGEELMIDADNYYILASVFKIPVLVEACFQMADGKFKPQDRWPLKVEDKNLPSGILTFLEDGLTPTVKDILTLMIIISDNTATDIMMKHVGKTAINQRMQQLGFDHIHVPLTVRELFEDMLPNADPTQDLYELDKLETEEGFKRGDIALRLSPDNNVGTPREMTALLCKIFEGKTPDRKWSDFALQILLKQQLNDRLPRLLPPGTRVAHKTGTLAHVRNDSGIIYANEKSHVALSIFAMADRDKLPKDPTAARQMMFNSDHAMGEIALLVYEAFK